MRARLHRGPASRHALGVVSLLLLAASPSGGSAQAGRSVPVGARVRVQPTGPGARWVQGQLVALTSDSVAIRRHKHGDTVTLATRSLARFEVSHGRSARTAKGALLGLGIGAGAGLLVGLALAADDCPGFCEINVGPEDVLALTALGGGLGAGVGALIGAVSSGERWQPVGPPHAAGRHGPTVQGAALGLRIPF
jgi:hypothetical protein